MINEELINKLLNDDNYTKKDIADLLSIKSGSTDGGAAAEAAASPDPEPEQENIDTEPDNKASAEANLQAAIKEISNTVNSELAKIRKAYEEFNLVNMNNKVESSKGIEGIFAEIIDPPFMKNENKGE